MENPVWAIVGTKHNEIASVQLNMKLNTDSVPEVEDFVCSEFFMHAGHPFSQFRLISELDCASPPVCRGKYTRLKDFFEALLGFEGDVSASDGPPIERFRAQLPDLVGKLLICDRVNHLKNISC